jgi:NifU-like protein involved in Fe-S cluster formation
VFNDIIVENFSAPRFAEELPGANLTLELGNPVCGDKIRVELNVADGVVQQARYQAWGCATSLATGNIFCAHADGRPLSAILGTPAQQMAQLLGELEPSQHHCLDMLRALFAQLGEKSKTGA